MKLTVIPVVKIDGVKFEVWQKRLFFSNRFVSVTSGLVSKDSFIGKIEQPRQFDTPRKAVSEAERLFGITVNVIGWKGRL